MSPPDATAPGRARGGSRALAPTVAPARAFIGRRAAATRARVNIGADDLPRGG
ncbi:hypothetical protein [Quisquiliibacterium transsilvanicum]|jgi:hypothetical protein|uniref:Uncharacterized protein n=1 Tax=Quisquiliibacterium transsilvanicum TaxID=1549638 RepID=A0A7W8HED4_9BURK|nr:hypothetical protein [Quisquiliibacterium transsilvanicum]MBB5270527.1 hypothetical protein [Quisquiliibacterium transsilvanicum]